MKQFCVEKGIIFQMSNPYCPEENGAAERDHATKFTRVRCVLKDSHMPAKLWPEALMFVEYIQNRTPMERLGGISPFEKLYGVKPDLSDLPMWGQVCWVHIPVKQRTDQHLDSRGLKCRLLGYSERYKAYRLLDVEYNRFVSSRDVTFDTLHKKEIMVRSFVSNEEELSIEEREEIEEVCETKCTQQNNNKGVGTTNGESNTSVGDSCNDLAKTYRGCESVGAKGTEEGQQPDSGETVNSEHDRIETTNQEDREDSALTDDMSAENSASYASQAPKNVNVTGQKRKSRSDTKLEGSHEPENMGVNSKEKQRLAVLESPEDIIDELEVYLKSGRPSRVKRKVERLVEMNNTHEVDIYGIKIPRKIKRVFKKRMPNPKRACKVHTFIASIPRAESTQLLG